MKRLEVQKGRENTSWLDYLMVNTDRWLLKPLAKVRRQVLYESQIIALQNLITEQLSECYKNN